MFPDEWIPGTGLVLRPLTPEDAQTLVTACNDTVVQRWLPLPHPYTHQHARALVREQAPRTQEAGSGLIRGIDQEGRLVGVIDLKHADWTTRCVEIGYWIVPCARGQRISSRAAQLLTAWAHVHGMRRVEARAAVDNLASLASLRRAGFVETRVLPGAGHTHSGPVDLVVLEHVDSG